MHLPSFAPHLTIAHGISDVSFYEKAFGAKELRRFSNDDGSIHVVEFSLGEQLFHLHEETSHKKEFAPESVGGTTVLIGLFVDDVDKVVEQAVAAGATLLSAPQDYDYGLRQAEIKDPFGHCWLIEKVI